MPVPDSPVPLLSEPPPDDEAQDNTEPVLVSVRVVFPAFAVMDPPGLTVKVIAFVATAVLTPTPITRAVVAPISKALPAIRVRIPINTLLGSVGLPRTDSCVSVCLTPTGEQAADLAGSTSTYWLPASTLPGRNNLAQGSRLDKSGALLPSFGE